MQNRSFTYTHTDRQSISDLQALLTPFQDMLSYAKSITPPNLLSPNIETCACTTSKDLIPGAMLSNKSRPHGLEPRGSVSYQKRITRMVVTITHAQVHTCTHARTHARTHELTHSRNIYIYIYNARAACTARHGSVQHGTAQRRTARHGLARCGAAQRHGTGWDGKHGTMRHETKRNNCLVGILAQPPRYIYYPRICIYTYYCYDLLLPRGQATNLFVPTSRAWGEGGG